jgi:uncharacterized membrane protein YcjF (UPF0283 family)
VLNKSVYFVLLLLCFVLVALIFNLVSKLFSLHHSLAYVYANFAVIILVLFKYDTIKDVDRKVHMYTKDNLNLSGFAHTTTDIK